MTAQVKPRQQKGFTVHHLPVLTRPTAEWQRRRAALTCAANARDAGELRVWLDMLGLR